MVSRYDRANFGGLMSQSLINLDNVYKTYKLGDVSVPALRGLSLNVGEGEFVAIIGSSGSGKSTLLNLVGGVDLADSGRVAIAGQDWARMNDIEMSALRNRLLGFVFQSFNLMPMLNVYENVEIPLLLQKEIDGIERKKRVTKLLEEVGLSEFLTHRPDKLSGGQRQRVAIARALVTRPKVVIADEPTANLDSETTKQVIAIMQEMNQKLGVTFLFSTHDEKLMSRVNRIVRMKDGKLVDP